jgi:hypothetical protein
MWKKSNVFLILLLVVNFGFSQNKKVADTIYVYEEVIVRDTIYIEKSLFKNPIDKVIVTPGQKGVKSQIILVQNNQKTTLTVDSLQIKKKKPFTDFRWESNSKFFVGVNYNSLFKEFGSKNQSVLGVGIFIKKTLFHPNFSIGTGLEILLSPTNLTVNDSISSSFLDGFFFTDTKNPKLFESLSTRGFQIQLPVQLYWKIQKFTPAIGVFVNRSSYSANFINYAGDIGTTNNETERFNAKSYYFGYLFELNYAIYKKWSISLTYAFGSTNTIEFTRNNDSFAVDKKITQRLFGTSILYRF